MEKITLGNLAEAFKALDALEAPSAKAPIDRKAINECFRPSNKTDALLEDYYDLNSQEDLQTAKDNREEEVAKAKLARIEKIVDLDANSAEELLPSYVGKYIVQCPQCMTLFYKSPEDVEHSDDESTVNVNETCQHCGNVSGYTLIGKVDGISEDEKDNYDEAEMETETSDLNLDFGEPAEDTEDTTSVDEVEIPEEPEEAAEEETVEKIAEEPEAEESKEKEESLNKANKDVAAKSEQESKNLSLHEDKDADELSKKLKEHNDYIAYLQQMIEQEEEALGKATNEFVKASIKRRLDSFKEDLNNAIPAEVKAEAAVEELPSPEELKKVDEKLAKTETKLTEATVGELTSQLNQITPFKGLKDATIRKIIALYAEDTDNKAKDLKIEDLKEWVGEQLGEFALTFAENLSAAQIFELGARDLKFVKACQAVEKFNIEHQDKDYPLTNDEIIKLAIDKGNDESIKLIAAEYKKLKEALEEARGPGKGQKLDRYFKLVNKLTKDELTVEEATELQRAKAAVELFVPQSEYEKKDKENLLQQLSTLIAIASRVDMPKGDLPKTKASLAEGSIMSEIEKFIANFDDEKAAQPTVEESVENEIKLAEVAAELENVITEDAAVKPNQEISNTDFMSMLKNPVFNEEVEEVEEALEVSSSIVNTIADKIAKLGDQFEVDGEAVVEKITPPEEFDFDMVENIIEESIDSSFSNFLTNVYSNVLTFKTTGCQASKKKLVVEGVINFKSGKTKATKFTFTKTAEGLIEGVNPTLASEKAFILTCKQLPNKKLLQVESIAYKYKIGDNLVEGLAVK